MRAVSKRRMARPMSLTPEETDHYRRLIEELAEQAEQALNTQQAEERMYKRYHFLTLSDGLGRAVCLGYSDEELLEILRQTARKLGRAPTQNEVFFLYRIYLKSRFRTWPAALRKAGMRQMPAADLEMPDWASMEAEEPEICAALQKVSLLQKRVGYPPRKREVPQAKILCERFGSWENTIAASDGFQKWLSERRSGA